MYCPKCGTQNARPGKFCIQCGESLPEPPPSQPAYRPPPSQQISTYIQPAHPSNPLAQVATIGGLTGMAGGALIVLGWLLGGGLPIMGLVFTGGGLLGVLAGDEGGGIFVLLTLALAAVVAIVPITGFLCASTGVSLFELRAYSAKHHISQAKAKLQQLRSRSTTVLVMMLLIAVFASLIPFVGGAFIGNGFYLMAAGAVTTFIGALYARTQIGPEAPISQSKKENHAYPKVPPIALTQQELRTLQLLEQATPHQEMASRLDMRPIEVSVLVTELLEKFEVINKVELVEKARRNGFLMPD